MQTATDDDAGAAVGDLGLNAPQVWDTQSAFAHLQALGQADSKRTTERRLNALALWPAELKADHLQDERGHPPHQLLLRHALDTARAKRHLPLFVQWHTPPNSPVCLHANDARGGRVWLPMPELAEPHNLQAAALQAAALAGLQRLQQHLGKHIVVFPHGPLAGVLRDAPPRPQVQFCAHLYPPVATVIPALTARLATTPYLQRLEDESIHIIREAVAEAERPVMLYSVGKDSGVMLHLARKAFFPAPPPFVLLHVDTRWKFQEMYLFRNRVAQEVGMELLVHTNPDAIAKNINPFDHGSALHTDITKTEGLKQALDQHRFDVVFGGARRDEEKSRAKERIFSFRTAAHRWDPKNQRPELWNLYNAKKQPGESIRVFPLSNWTELDIWQYIYQEHIPVVPLYFAKTRPVVERNGLLLMVNDDRFRLLPGEPIQERQVRFRTLGCYPLTGAVLSTATTVADIVLELVAARTSERQGRAIDSDASASMEKKKQEGYF
jgi:sulfate adenylyltransferase subunit 2